MGSGRRWTRDEILVAVHLYERIPFGQQHQSNPQVVELARWLDRTPGSVAMKLNNLTSLDPEEAARGVTGLPGASELDRTTWAEFRTNPAVVEEAEHLWEEREPGGDRQYEPTWPPAWQGPTVAEGTHSVRLAQTYFRRVVLANFGRRCALTGLEEPGLLVASHIVGWASTPEHRVDPSNGLLLNRLHDGAFDRHLIAFDEELRLMVSPRLRDQMPKDDFQHLFLRHQGQALPATRHAVSPELLRLHRQEFARLAS